MPELRQNPITGKWAVIATERARRPEDFNRAEKENTASNNSCPFCYNNEQLTPPEVMAYRPPETEPDTPGWKVRVVPNKFPAFTFSEQLTSAKAGIYNSMSATGAHEVIIDSPDHKKSLALLSNKEIVSVISAYKDRYIELKKDTAIKYILIIVNHGKEAGASLEHPHAQLFGSPIIPSNVTEELDGASKHYKNTSQCIFCNIIREELQTKIRVILDTKNFLVFCPYASGSPFETWIVPKKHNSHFEDISPQEINNLASVLRLILARFYEGLNDPAYNFYIHTSPCQDPPREDYHWHIEIFPKLTIQAGFEVGSGIMINIARPEDTAAFLKKVEV